jgi:chitinase
MDYWSCYARNYQVSDIPDKVNYIQYNFWNIDNEFKLVSGDPYLDLEKQFIYNGVLPLDKYDPRKPQTFGNFNQFKKLKDSGRKLNISLVIAQSDNLLNALKNTQDRTCLIESIIYILEKYDILNGVTFTYPETELSYFLLFIKDLKQKCRISNVPIEISLIINNNITPNHLIRNFIPFVDSFFLMSHDFRMQCSPAMTVFHTNPRKSEYNKGFSCEEISDQYLEFIPNQKLYISGAFYSRGFSNTNGPGEIGVEGSSDVGLIQGKIDYNLLPLQGATEYNDNESKAAYSYDCIKKIINTYDNEVSLLEKVDIIQNKQLGGITIFDISGDKPITHPKSLIKLLHRII